MPWKEVSAVDQRREFIGLALVEGSNRRELCRRFGISPETGYEWLRRYASGDRALEDRSRRPLSSPLRTAGAMESAILGIRDAHPAWGARKIAAVISRRGDSPPAMSTIHTILQRHGRIVAPEGGPRATLRFEREAPNQLWQMDFKGWSRLTSGEPLHPLTVVDDHSRFALCLDACADQTRRTVMASLERVFCTYGLPQAFFVDNGKPWGDSRNTQWTRLGVWLLKLGVDLIHSRPYHPQSRGKNERFHRSLDEEVLALKPLHSLAHAQRAFDAWREVYNFERPHGALDHDVPASRFRISPRSMPRKLPEHQYGSGDIVRSVSSTKAYIVFKGRNWKVPEAFCGERLAIRPLDRDGHYGVFFASHRIATIDLTEPKCVNHVSEQVSTMSPG
jgi:transposase InsO family protein